MEGGKYRFTIRLPLASVSLESILDVMPVGLGGTYSVERVWVELKEGIEGLNLDEGTRRRVRSAVENYRRRGYSVGEGGEYEDEKDAVGYVLKFVTMKVEELEDRGQVVGLLLEYLEAQSEGSREMWGVDSLKLLSEVREGGGGGRLKVATWNTLAFQYCKSSSHPGANEEVLRDEYREGRVGDVLRGLGREHFGVVICLQEVDKWEELYKPIFHDMGYGYCYGLRSMTPIGSYVKHRKGPTTASNPTTVAMASKRDRVVIAYSKLRFDMISSRGIDLDDLAWDVRTGRRFRRNNTAVMICLKDKVTGAKFVVCNVHLYWNPRSEDVKLLQSKLVSQRCKDFAASEANGCPVIVCGDFNSLPKEGDGGVYDFWVKGEGKPEEVKKRVWGYYEEGADEGNIVKGRGEGWTQQRYMLDFTLNRFCRWLRMLGIDAEIESKEEEEIRKSNKSGHDIPIFRRCRVEKRALLTTSTRLLQRKEAPPSAHLINTNNGGSDMECNLAKLLLEDRVKLYPRRFLTICVKCGGKIEEIKDKEEIRRAVEEKHAPANALPLFKCDKVSCKSWYWWNQNKSSSAGRAKNLASTLFEYCVKRGVSYDDDLGLFEGCDFTSKVGEFEEEVEEEVGGEDEEEERPPVSTWLGEKVLENSCGKFKSAYRNVEDTAEVTKFTNLTRDFRGTLDYIFYQTEEFKVVSRLELPVDTGEFGERKILPNEKWPSDHLTLLAELEMVEGGGQGGVAGINEHNEEDEDCRCGCAPKGLPLSLFEMDRRRKAWRAARGGRG